MRGCPAHFLGLLIAASSPLRTLLYRLIVLATTGMTGICTEAVL